MIINTAGIAAVAVFYLVILFVGMLAAWKQRKAGRGTSSPEENIMLAKRDLGLFVGVLTMTGKSIMSKYKCENRPSVTVQFSTIGKQALSFLRVFEFVLTPKAKTKKKWR